MNAKTLLAPGGPWAHLFLGSTDEAFDQRRQFSREEPRQLTVRHLGGERMATKEGCLAEMAAALQFPPYFGGNWDACVDCLDDLASKAKAGLVLVVFRAAHVLKSAPESELKKLASVWGEVAERWSKQTPPHAFRILLQAKPPEADDLRLRWKKAGVTLG